jgi:hypothetical protein
MWAALGSATGLCRAVALILLLLLGRRAGEPVLVVRVHDRAKRDRPHHEDFDGFAAWCYCFPAVVALLFSCCCCCCCFLGLVEDVVRFGRLNTIAVTLGGRVRMSRREESRDEGHEHCKGAQRRSQPMLRERGVTSPVCVALCSSHGRHCKAVRRPAAKLAVSDRVVLRRMGRILQVWQSVSALKKVSRLAPKRRGFGADTPTVLRCERARYRRSRRELEALKAPTLSAGRAGE